MLQLVKFRKQYGNYLALQIEDFIIKPGIYLVKGVNGSGKSTLLKAIAGILYFEGNILLDNRISLIKQTVAYRRLVNFAEAEPVFPEFLTGKELIRVFASAKGGPAKQEDCFIQTMNMESYIHQPISAYSTGMLKKLSLVLAFMGNPRIILLDEPFITLDSESLKILYQWIAEKQQQNGISFLLSSHQALESEALSTAKEILVQSKTVKFNS